MKIVLMVIMAVWFSGCSQMAIDKASATIKEYGLENHVTSVCYDLVDKKDCPYKWVQYDLSVVPFVPISSRFCFSVLEDNNVTYPDGMVCYSYDIIRKD